MCFATDCFLYFQVFLSKLPIIFSESSKLHNSEGKVLSVLKTELNFNDITKAIISSYYDAKDSIKANN